MNLVRRRFDYVACVLCAFASMPLVLKAQYTAYEGKKIVTIQFEPPNQPVDLAEINRILPLKNGQPLQQADVRTAIERLFATGRYTDIQVDARPYQDGVIVRFLTQNRWFIGQVAVGGDLSSPPNPGQLETAARLDLGQPYTESKLNDALSGEKRLLEANGLYGSTVHPVVHWDNQYQQVTIRFEVDSGERARFTAPVLIGDIKMDTTRILTATRFRRWLIHTWKPATQTRVRQGLDGVRKLYQKDHRLEAKVSLDAMKFTLEDNRVTPTLRIDAGPRIDVRTMGAKLSESKLQRYVPVFEEHAVDDDLLREGARNLRDYFQSQGYFDADVQFKTQRVISDQATIDYLVNIGTRHKLVHIGIAGNRYFTSATLRERLYLRTASFLTFPHGRYSENLLSRDEETIRNLYQSNGFRDVKVTHRLEDSYQGRAGDIAVFLEIQEGPQFLIGNLTVDGIERLNKPSIMAQLSSVAGQPFSEYNVAVDRDAILGRYFADGFPNATFEWSSKPGAEPDRIDLTYTIRDGQQQFVRQVLFNPDGLEHTKPELIYRNLKLNPGDPLSPIAISDTQRRLYDLGIFARVDAAVQDPDGATEQKYVLYDLEEARRYSIAIGLGAEFARIGGCEYCLDAPAGAPGFSPRVSFDITRNNLWGLAQRISLRTRLSTLEKRALLNYTIPRFRGNNNLTLDLTGLYLDSKDVRTFSYKREEGSAQLSQKVGKTLTFQYRFTYRHVSVDEATLKITPDLIPLLSQPVRVGLLATSIIHDRRDDPVDPHKGIFNTLELGMADHIFGSERNFVRFLARNATYHPIGKRIVFARSTEFGDIYAFHYNGNPLDAIPLPERFFGGGGSSDRGFPEFQSGPRDLETGFPIGGTALFFNQTELRFPLIGENVGGVLFHDFGNTFSSLSSLSFRVKQADLQDFNYMVHAVGFGIRYRTPIGPLRVDLAYSINPPKFFGFKGTEQDLVDAGVNPCSGPYAYLCTVQNVSHFQFFFSIGQTF
ncbi:MAG TPA: POTRA domain-containing protein [Bryobacteraceae bacterium]|nr:POTRA domain-containing protein [Bryobacteraceae bacterium]